MSRRPAAGTAKAGTRQVFFLDLKDDPQSIADYEAWHAAGRVPAPVIRSIRQAGIASMQIFRSGNRLVMITAVDEDASAADRGDQDTDVAAWEALMDDFQQRLPWAAAGQKWVPATRIFDLEEQG